MHISYKLRMLYQHNLLETITYTVWKLGNRIIHLHMYIIFYVIFIYLYMYYLYIYYTYAENFQKCVTSLKKNVRILSWYLYLMVWLWTKSDYNHANFPISTTLNLIKFSYFTKYTSNIHIYIYIKYTYLHWWYGNNTLHQ